MVLSLRKSDHSIWTSVLLSVSLCSLLCVCVCVCVCVCLWWFCTDLLIQCSSCFLCRARLLPVVVLSWGSGVLVAANAWVGVWGERGVWGALGESGVWGVWGLLGGCDDRGGEVVVFQFVMLVVAGNPSNTNSRRKTGARGHSKREFINCRVA